MSASGPYKPWSLSAYALVRNRRGHLLFLRRAPGAGSNAGKWDLPGGKVENGEGLDHGLRRELHEESGLDGRIKNLQGSLVFSIKRVRVVALIFGVVVRSGKVRLSREHDAFVWVSPEEVSRLELCSYFERLPALVAGQGKAARRPSS